MGKLLQHAFIIYLGIRTHEYVDILSKFDTSSYTHCKQFHDKKSKLGDLISTYGVKSLRCAGEFRPWLLLTNIVQAAVGLIVFFFLPLTMFIVIYESEILDMYRRRGYDVENIHGEPRPRPQGRGMMNGAWLIPVGAAAGALAAGAA